MPFEAIRTHYDFVDIDFNGNLCFSNKPRGHKLPRGVDPVLADKINAMFHSMHFKKSPFSGWARTTAIGIVSGCLALGLFRVGVNKYALVQTARTQDIMNVLHGEITDILARELDESARPATGTQPVCNPQRSPEAQAKIAKLQREYDGIVQRAFAPGGTISKINRVKKTGSWVAFFAGLLIPFLFSARRSIQKQN
jgi:hypothetical protein